ncbi:MAG: glycosyltransferase [Infirmifilum sp.]
MKTSLIWLNYNSINILETVKKSLSSIFDLNYDNYELIIVDNASNDGSFKAIVDYVDKHKPSNVIVKYVRSDVNRGYAGGMNLGWQAREPDSKYVVFLNNDLIVEPESLRQLIDFLDYEDSVAAVSGLIMQPDNSRIYSAGWAVDEILNVIGICSGATRSDCITADKPHPVSYADGAYYVAKVDVIKRFGFDGKPFIDETFLYWEDSLLSFRLWNSGYSSYYVPVKAGVHYVSLTTQQIGAVKYYPLRGRFIAYSVVKVPYSRFVAVHYYRVKLLSRILCKYGYEKFCKIYKAVVDGWTTGNKIRSKFGYIELKKVPRIRLSSIIKLGHKVLPMRLITPLYMKAVFIKSNYILHDILSV